MGKLFSWANVHRGLFTSFLGLCIILASVASVFTHGQSWTEAAVGIAVGTGLMGLPDPKIGGGGATGVVGGLVVALLVFGGCSSQKRLLAKYGTQTQPTTLAVTDSVTLKVPVEVKTKADSLRASFSLDSLADADCGDTLHLVSAGGQATIAVWKSPVTTVGGSQRLNALVKVPPQLIHDTVTVTKVVTLYGKCPPQWIIAPTPKPTKWQRAWGYYQDGCTALLSILLIVLLILAGFRLKRFVPFLGVALVLAGAGTLGGCHTAKHVPQPKDRPDRQPEWIRRDLRHNR